MVRGELARERQCQLRAFALQGAECQGRSHLGIAFTRNKGRQHTPAGDLEEIGDDTAECEVGILEELVHPVLAVAPGLHQGDPRARHIPHGAHVGRRHKAGPDEPMGQEFGDPSRIPFVRLFARAAAQLVGVANIDLDRTREDVIQYTGFQYTPVLSIATTGQCCSTSQSDKARSDV